MLFLILLGVAFFATIFLTLTGYALKKIVKTTFLYIALPVVFGLAVYNIATVSTTSSTEKILHVGTSADFPPFSFIDDTNTIVGFDIDVICEVAKRLRTPLKIANMPFGTLLSSLQAGSIEVVAAGMTSTPERTQHVFFTKPYLENDPLVIVSLTTSSVHTIEDLKNKEVVVNEGYTADTYLTNLNNGAKIIRLKTPSEAFLALSTGRAHAYVTASNTVKLFFENVHNKEIFKTTSIAGTAENVALVISKKCPNLLQDIQHILDAMNADGTLLNLKKKWKLA